MDRSPSLCSPCARGCRESSPEAPRSPLSSNSPSRKVSLLYGHFTEGGPEARGKVGDLTEVPQQARDGTADSAISPLHKALRPF